MKKGHPKNPKPFHGQATAPAIRPHTQGIDMPSTNPKMFPGNVASAPPLTRMGPDRPSPKGETMTTRQVPPGSGTAQRGG